MPSARVHDFITVSTAVVGTPAALTLSLPDMNLTNAALLGASYLASGLLFSPDLDLRSRPYKRWGGLRFIWIPYQKMVPHRSWISHSIFAGSIIRVAYFTFMMALLTLIGLGVVNLLTPVDPTHTMLSISGTITQWIRFHPAAVIYAAAGFILGAAAHVVADSIYSHLKRRLRRYY
jgi:uncharacterized metal-binding protein